MVKIIVVGQTPPPYGGQALMIEYMLNANFEHIEFFHVRMNFSKEMDERGKFSFYKLNHIIYLIKETYKLKFRHNIDILYYPLSNAPKISIYRDAFFLLFTRFLFKRVIFHFHAAGISEELPKMNFLERLILKSIFNKPDLTIALSEFNPRDGEYLNCKNNFIIPYGIPYTNLKNISAKASSLLKTRPLKVLFVGLLNGTKGEGYLLDAIYILNQQKYQINLQLAGKFESEHYEKMFFKKVEEYNLQNNVEYLGVVVGESKHQAFLNADIFCFPSFFISESFGIVQLEAMQYHLPIIATKWRGIQSIIEIGKNGFLVDIKNARQLAEKIKFFLDNPEEIITMGNYSRKLFDEKYTLEKWTKRLEDAFLSISK